VRRDSVRAKKTEAAKWGKHPLRLILLESGWLQPQAGPPGLLTEVPQQPSMIHS